MPITGMRSINDIEISINTARLQLLFLKIKHIVPIRFLFNKDTVLSSTKSAKANIHAEVLYAFAYYQLVKCINYQISR